MRLVRLLPRKTPKFPTVSSPLLHLTRPSRRNSTAAAGTPMASSIGGGGGGGRGSRARMPAGGMEDAQARMVARAEQSGGHSSDNDKLQAIFRPLLNDFVKKVAKSYLNERFVTEQGHNAIVHYTIDTIIAFEGNRLPPTENLMEKYISQNEEKIKKLVKKYVDMFWIGAGVLQA